jgi:hypothetical protein
VHAPTKTVLKTFRFVLSGACMIAFAALLFEPSLGHAQTEDSFAAMRKAFAHPPDDARIMMRWWWFGPAVSKPELKRELEQMKAEGIGGVEIATLYPLALDDPNTGFHNEPFLSNEYIDALHFTAATARELGMRVDITLGSGWPFGGPHIPVTQAAGELRVETVPVPAGAQSIAVPNISAGEKLIAAFLCTQSSGELALRDAERLSAVQSGSLQLPTKSDGQNAAVFFIASRTGMMVKRPAVGAEGFVLDHYDQHAIENHLHAVGDRLLQAFGDQPPYAVFSDSLEDYGSNWTGDLMEEFRRRRGYDLTPYLPALIGDIGPETAAVRNDWGRTLTELANERFLRPMHTWAHQHHTLLRSQTYGFPPVALSSNEYEDLPEGEGKATMLMWREFSDTRWAASAGHLLGRPVISSEVWTWLHSPAFRATPLDMKAEADLHFLQGINQLVGHGWPYSPEIAGEPGWRMYAAGAFNAHNPWSFAMPDVAGYLQRVSFALRQGKPANDVALLLPNDDAWATFKANRKQLRAVTNSAGFDESGLNVSIDESMIKLLGKTVIGAALDAGFNCDFVDADAIEKKGLSYPVLILPDVDRLPLATYRKIEEYAHRGGIVIATRRLPSTAPGMVHADADTVSIKAISRRLFEEDSHLGHYVADDRDVGRCMATYRKPDVVLSPEAHEVGFIHRKLIGGDLYFFANTSNQAHDVTAHFRHTAKRAEWWDPFTGDVLAPKDPAHVELDLEPYGSRLVMFSDSDAGESSASAALKSSPTSRRHSLDLSQDWNLSFDGLSHPTHLPQLRSWSEDNATRFYSGVATYQKHIRLSAGELTPGTSVIIDFGIGTAVPIPTPLPAQNMRAYFEGPIRDAAEVYVNGERAGVVWHPPYTVDITRFVKPGRNELRIAVGNTAINAIAGRALPDYRLLDNRYGERFVPQGMENLKPLPSGILGHPQIVFGSTPEKRRGTPQR